MLSLTLSLPACADSSDVIDGAMERLAARMFSEQNIGLLFGMLRQGLTAATEGRPTPEVTSEMAARMEALGKDMQREMGGAAVLLLDGMERELRDSLRHENRI